MSPLNTERVEQSVNSEVVFLFMKMNKKNTKTFTHCQYFIVHIMNTLSCKYVIGIF